MSAGAGGGGKGGNPPPQLLSKGAEYVPPQISVITRHISRFLPCPEDKSPSKLPPPHLQILDPPLLLHVH